jgi:1-acyl-sn-glycerol-3-phosphate acyltransferase
MKLSAPSPHRAQVAATSARSRDSALLTAGRHAAYFFVIIAFIVGTPLYYLIALASSRGKSARERRMITQMTIHKGTALLFRILRATGVLHVHEESSCSVEETNATAGVIVANHPSMLDALFFLSRHPQMVCVMKARLLTWPIIGGFARRAGYLPFDETPELWHCAKEARDDGASILVFPEGTRSPATGLHHFKRGAARIATELELPIIPYVLEMQPVTFGRARPWWHPPGQQITLRALRLPLVPATVNFLDSDETTKRRMPLDNRRESIRLTESLEVLINSSLSSTREVRPGISV